MLVSNLYVLWEMGSGDRVPYGFRIFFVLNRARDSNPQRLTYTQRLFEYPSDRALDAVHFTHERVNM